MSLRSSSQESLPQSPGSGSSHASPVASDASGEFPDDEHTSGDPWYSSTGPSDTTTLTISRNDSEDGYRYSQEDLFAPSVTAVAESLPGSTVSEEDMRAKMTLALEEHLQDHPDITARYEHRLSIEGSSPKPCIVPGNALQLIDEDHSKTSPPPPPASSSIIILNSSHTHAHEHERERDKSPTDTSSYEHSTTQKRPIPRVRFRSRVRITSGIHRNRRSSTGGTTGTPGTGGTTGTTTTGTTGTGGTTGGTPATTNTRTAATTNSTPTSSTSGSPSSSISAPLRWQADENTMWGPLGRRLSAYANANAREGAREGSWRRRGGAGRREGAGRSSAYSRTNGGSDGATHGNGNGNGNGKGATNGNGNGKGATNGRGNGKGNSVQSMRSNRRVDERTPLISHGRPCPGSKVAYCVPDGNSVDGNSVHEDSVHEDGYPADENSVDENENEEDENYEQEEENVIQRDRALRAAAALRREEEAVFGRWPWRLVNRHWWWWHLEPVVCCCCPDDSDYEE